MSEHPVPSAQNEETPDSAPDWRPSPCQVLAVVLLYALCLGVASNKLVARATDHLPALVPAVLEDLWQFEWQRQQLLNGDSAWPTPAIHAPRGVPEGFFPDQWLPFSVHLLGRLVLGNPVLAYNLAWAAGFLGVGMAVYFLAGYITRNGQAAALAGGLAMLSTPVRLHAVGHLDILYLGVVPLALLAWLRWADQPGPRRWALAVGAGTLVVLTSLTHVLLIGLLISLQTIGSAWRPLRDPERRPIWLRTRLPWIGAAVGLWWIVLNAVHGDTLKILDAETYPAGTQNEFARMGTYLWAYLVPAPGSRLVGLFEFNPYELANVHWKIHDVCSYLGILCIILIHHAAVTRTRFPHAGLLWSAIAFFGLLSLGVSTTLGSTTIPLPAGFLWEEFSFFRWIRYPARFNLGIAVLAPVIAAAAWAHWSANRKSNLTVLAGLIAAWGILLADLGEIPIVPARLTPMPAGYAWIRDQNPNARIVEAPTFDSQGLNAVAEPAIWQLQHQLATSSGSTPYPDAWYEAEVLRTSPFRVDRLLDPTYPALDQSGQIELVSQARYEDYVWLYMNAHAYDYVVAHRSGPAATDLAGHLPRILDPLAHATVFADDATTILDASRLREPQAPVVVPTQGWGTRNVRQDKVYASLARRAFCEVYNPDPNRPVRLALEAASSLHTRHVLLKHNDQILAEWTIEPGNFALHISPPFQLPPGRATLILESDGADHTRRIEDGVPNRASLHVAALCFQWAPTDDAAQVAMPSPEAQPDALRK